MDAKKKQGPATDNAAAASILTGDGSERVRDGNVRGNGNGGPPGDPQPDLALERSEWGGVDGHGL